MVDYKLEITRDKISTFYQQTELGLKSYVAKRLLSYFKSSKINHTRDYVYAKGNIPILLVAHLDTVHVRVPHTILYDAELNQLWSADGIGGDDRNGVLAIFEILEAGYLPYVLFTTGEERGGIGATAFVTNKPKLPVKYMIEIDRVGSNDAVFYDCNNLEFIDYITKETGYKEEWGSYTDIVDIMTEYNIAGVNFSCGYYNAHTKQEYVDFYELEVTILTIMSLLEDESKVTYYTADLWTRRSFYSRSYYYDDRDPWGGYDKCEECGKWGMLTEVNKQHLCNDCLIKHFALKKSEVTTVDEEYYYYPTENLLFEGISDVDRYFEQEYQIYDEQGKDILMQQGEFRVVSVEEMWSLYEGGAIFWM